MDKSNIDESNIDESEDTIQNLMRKLYYNRLDDNRIPNSDIKLIVGRPGDKIKYFSCHKFVLSLRSAVFHAMFNGQFQAEKDEVRITDLSPIGFENLLRFMYCDEIINITDTSFTATYLAADKYLVTSLCSKLLDSVNTKLSIDNAALIYNELLKLDVVLNNSTLTKVINLINLHAELVFQSESFLSINNDTLINLLEKDTLIIKEFDLFKSVLKWINKQLELNQQELNLNNQLIIFNSIKHLIRFSLMNKNEFNKIPSNLFTNDEFNQLNQFFNNNKSIQFSNNFKKRNQLNVGKLIYDYRTHEYKMVGIHDEFKQNCNYIYFKNGVYTDDLLNNPTHKRFNDNNIDKNVDYQESDDEDIDYDQYDEFDNGYIDDERHFLNTGIRFRRRCDIDDENNIDDEKLITKNDKNTIYIYKISRTFGDYKFEKGVSLRFGSSRVSFSRNGQDFFKQPVAIKLNDIITGSIDASSIHYYRIGYSRLKLEKIFDDDNNLDVKLKLLNNIETRPFAWEIYFMY